MGVPHIPEITEFLLKSSSSMRSTRRPSRSGVLPPEGAAWGEALFRGQVLALDFLWPVASRYAPFIGTTVPGPGDATGAAPYGRYRGSRRRGARASGPPCSRVPTKPVVCRT